MHIVQDARPAAATCRNARTPAAAAAEFTWEIAMIKTKTAPYGITLLRVSLGVLFLAHVALKIFVFTIPGFVAYFAPLGLPAVAAYGVIALELVGGLALILGVYAPWVAVPLAIEMLGTIVLVHGHGTSTEASDPAGMSHLRNVGAPVRVTLRAQCSRASGGMCEICPAP